MLLGCYEEHCATSGQDSNFVTTAMRLIAAMKKHLEISEKGAQSGSQEMVTKADVVAVLLDLNNAYYSFFSRIDDPEVASKIADTWHKRLRKYKKIVLNDAVQNILSTPSDYHRAPNLNDVIVECERICYNSDYRKS